MCPALLLQKSYNAYKHNLGDTEPVLIYKEWYSERMEESPLFYYYWGTTLNLELLLLQFLKANREGNFLLYIESLSKILL